MLSTLGEIDYGVYNIIAGVVVLFAFVQTAMSSATLRFLNFEMGQGTPESVARVFSMSMTTHISMSLLLFILAESVGLWFVSTQLNIPPQRVGAAMWVYQFSVFTACVNIIRVPYHATIIAHEKMSFYAYISIVESLLNLLLVYLLLILRSDKLILYSVGIFVLSIVVFACYRVYCIRQFTSTRYHFFWDRAQYMKLLSFSGWSLFGSLGVVGASQGLNILINIFYGVVVNAAMGIANQVQVAVVVFMNNFQTAFNPQLIKSCAAGECDYFEKLICQTSKYSFFLIYIIALPLITAASSVLDLWLGEVPPYTEQFVQLLLICILIEAVATPLWTAVQAVGRIRNYQIMIAVIVLLNIPISYLCFHLGYAPTSAVIVKVVLGVVALFARGIYLSRVAQFSLMGYARGVIVPCLGVVMLSAPISIYMLSCGGTLLAGGIAVGVAVLAIWGVGLTRCERNMVVGYLKTKFAKS